MITRDSLWKGAIEDLLEDFLSFFYSDVSFDLERGVEFLDKELEEIYPLMGIEHKSRRVDKLIKLWTKTGEERWLLIHVEVQGYKDDRLTERVYQYFYRLRDSFKMPVSTLVIFTDADVDYLPDQYKYQVLGTELTFKYPVYNIARQSREDLERSTNPFAMVVLTALTYLNAKRRRGEEQYREKRHLARLLFRRNYSKEKIRKVLMFIRFHIEIKDDVWNHKFEKEVEHLTIQKNVTMGIEEQVMEMLKDRFREEGREELLFDIVKKMTLKGKSASEISDLLEVEETLIVSMQKSIKR